MNKFFSAFFKITLCLTVFLIPLFFLPFTVESFEFNKIYLFCFLTGLMVLLWLGNMVFGEKKLKFNRTPLDIFVLLFLAAMILSAVFSQDKPISWFGIYGRFWPSLLGAIALAIFYFVLTNNVKVGQGEFQDNKVSANSIFRLLLVSSLLAVIFAYFSLFGVWTFLSELLHFPLPQAMNLRISNTLGGSLIDSFALLSLFLAFIAAFLVGWLALIEKRKGLVSFILGYVLLFGIIGFLIIVNFWPAWLALSLGLAVFLTTSFKNRLFKEDVTRLSLPIFLLIVALICIAFNPLRAILPQQSAINNLSNNFMLDLMGQKEAWTLALQGVKEHPVFGAGLGNFGYLFSKFKPANIAQSQFWQIRFDRGASHIAELLGTGGIAGTIFYLALVGMFLIVGWLYLSASFRKTKEKAEEGAVLTGLSENNSRQKITALALFSGFAVLLAAQFLYYQNFSLAFGFWLVMGISAAGWSSQKPKEKIFSFKNYPEAGLAGSVLFWVFLTAVAVSFFVLGKYYLADVYYRDYLLNPVKNLHKLEKAASLADSQPVYHLALSLGYFQKFKEEIAKPDLNRETALKILGSSVEELRVALREAPNRAEVQEISGAIYRDLSVFDVKGLEIGIQSLLKARELDPRNAVILSELGKLYLANEQQEQAKKMFEEAISQRQDYVDAYLQLSLLDESQGKLKEAQERLEVLVQQVPTSVEVHFSLGRMYYNNKEYEKAKQHFEWALQLFPSHSNSMYSLGLVYEKQGDVQKALEIFEKVLELNPGNQDVVNKIETLKNPQTLQESQAAPEEQAEAKPE